MANGEATSDLTWDEVYPKLSALMRSRTSVNALYILGDYAMLASVLGGALWAWGSWRDGTLAIAGFAPIALLALFVIGALQHRLSGLGHEASHYAMFRNRLANDLVSDFLLMFPTFAITQQFRATHLDHHRFVNDPRRDPDAVRLGNGLPGAFPKSKRRFLLRYVVGCLWLPELVRYILGQGFNAGPFAKSERPLKNPYSLRVAVAMLAGFWAALFALAIYAGMLVPLVLFWIVPLITSYPFLMQLREIAHHSNAPDAGDLTNSRIFLVHPLLRFSVFPYGQEYHLTHHLFGIMPHYRAAQAHGLLMRYRPYREHAIVCTGYFLPRPGTNGPTVLDVLSQPRKTGQLPGLSIAHPELLDQVGAIS